ncbi:hypothetical protein Q9L42_016600 [Methylomarinum sp. Ch1-1]|uniref:Alpha/beta hydrolase n=1 Tax=Methylomarinum roseum TaxID=3067653 RepID=A0AAU7NSI1_9GAMM
MFINAAAQQPSHQDNLHIYIDGDGTPWMRGRWPTSDPTARNPMILKILQADPSPAILLGRPCYHGLGESNACDVRYWTSHRYAQAVVDSMKTALRRWAAKTSHPKLTLIGFSGGGVLSVLMSYDLKEVETLITVAANLDVAAWSRQHNYRPLPQSLNPVDSPPLPARIRQIHFAGLRDQNVPAAIIKHYSERQHSAQFHPLPEFDHHCCWAENWSDLLKEININ